MTDWRAVGIGFLVQLVLGVFAFAIPGLGHVGAGLIGGFVAGYLAGGGLLRGAWHGTLAGAIGGLVVAVLLAGLVTFVGSIGLGPLGALAGGGVFVLVAVTALLLAIDSAIGGAVGGLLG